MSLGLAVRVSSAVLAAYSKEMEELAECLRAWRDRTSPRDVGLPVQRLRRAPGLRREELAQLAGLSVDYLSRLEQGRATSPSPQVLAALARALRLDDAERDHLYRLAGQMPPGPGRMPRQPTPSMLRVLDRLTDVPTIVIDPSWQIVQLNPLAAALTGEAPIREERDGNILWRHFTGSSSRVVRTDAEVARFEEEAVADLHAALGRYPEDPRLHSLIDDLRAASTRFAELWEARPVARHTSARKMLEHPEVGRITLDCDVMLVEGSDLRIIVYTAAPGSKDADALALLAVVGLQSFQA